MSDDRPTVAPDRVRTDELQPGDQIRHPHDWTLFTVSSVETLDSLGSPLDFHNRKTDEMERGLRVTGADSDGETVHVDCAPSHLWHREGRPTTPMSVDRPTVAPEPRRNADGTFTLTTDDAGEVRVACPPWCSYEHPYRESRTKAEIAHKSEPQWALTAPTAEFGEVGVGPVHISQHPYDPTGSAVLVVVQTDTEEFAVGPADARRFSVAFRQLADLIDATADQVEAIRAGENR